MVPGEGHQLLLLGADDVQPWWAFSAIIVPSLIFHCLVKLFISSKTTCCLQVTERKLGRGCLQRSHALNPAAQSSSTAKEDLHIMLTSFIKILTMFIHQVTSPPSPHAMNIDDFQPPSHSLPNTPPPQQQQTMAWGTKIYHPILNGKPANIALVCPCYPWLISFLGQPCDKDGNYLPLNTPPPPHGTATNDDWAPYEDEIQFRTANLLYQCHNRTSMTFWSCGHYH